MFVYWVRLCEANFLVWIRLKIVITSSAGKKPRRSASRGEGKFEKNFSPLIRHEMDNEKPACDSGLSSICQFDERPET
jgi:hypothetical protein